MFLLQSHLRRRAGHITYFARSMSWVLRQWVYLP